MLSLYEIIKFFNISPRSFSYLFLLFPKTMATVFKDEKIILSLQLNSLVATLKLFAVYIVYFKSFQFLELYLFPMTCCICQYIFPCFCGEFLYHLDMKVFYSKDNIFCCFVVVFRSFFVNGSLHV